MKLFFVLTFAFALAVGLIFVRPLQTYGQNDTNIANLPPGVVIDKKYGPVFAGDYIIQLKDSTPINSVDDKAVEVAEKISTQGGNVSHVYDNAIKGFSVKNVSDLSIFVGDPDIKTVEPDSMNQAHSQYIPKAVQRLGGRQMTVPYRIDGREFKPNIDIAVMDDKIYGNHPDLNLYKTVDIIPPSTATGAASFHGIHVAGICCARDNLGGVAGILPGARVWSISVMKPNGGAGSDFIAGWDYIRANAASIEIATMSLGCSSKTAGACALGSAENTAITNMVNAGVTFFVSAGNDGKDATNNRYCMAASAICVSAMTDTDGLCGGKGPDFDSGNPDDARADYSNYGSTVDIMAPGTQIISLSTSPAHLSDEQVVHGGGPAPYIGATEQGAYAAISGTSMSTPYAAGIGGIIKLKNPSFTPSQVKANLLANAYPQTQACDGLTKGGLAHGANSGSSEKIAWAGNY
jgi:subtilisin